MAERCSNCGAELFTGQQFCRACGTPTRQFPGEELPTQILQPGGQEQQPQQQQPAAPPLATSPLPGRDTSDPIYGGAGYSRYQPPVPQRPTAPVVAPLPVAPRPRSRAWIYAILGLILFFAGASFVAGLFFMNRQAQRVTRVVTRPNVAIPGIPPPPLPPRASGEEGAEGFGGQSTVTKTYPLAANGSFSLRNFSGDITVEGWDEQQAEVKIIRHGGDPERAAFHITQEEGGRGLTFNSTPEKTGGGVHEVEYVVKLPRNLRELEIVSINSNVDLAGVHSASISINVQRGNIELDDVSGTVNSRTTKGNTTVVLAELAKNAPQVFNAINGNIELELAPGTNAELKAETVDGDIEVDEDLGVKVEKRMIGQQAVGRLGTGGEAIVAKVISGNIKIKN
ncbi:MAG: hypothetical protein QOG71_974 [Pyrinomonadaceae bacterium]|nr:hypothetical protein [Pyrinomonadaceae bacterium]